MSFPSLGMVAEMIASKVSAAPNKTITLSGDASGSGTAGITATLATVNSDVGSFQGITVNGKGLVTAAIATAVLPNVSTGSPTGSTNTTAIMMGLGATATITPKTTGRICFTIQGSVGNSTDSDGANIFPFYGTGSAPANQAAQTGTQGSAAQILVNNAVSLGIIVPFSVTVIATGLAIGTAVWMDIALAVRTGGTANIYNTSVSAHEF